MAPNTPPPSPRLAPVRLDVPVTTADHTASSSSSSSSGTQQSPADSTGSSPALPVREATPAQLENYARVRELVALMQAPALSDAEVSKRVKALVECAAETLAPGPLPAALQRGLPQFEETAALVFDALFSPQLLAIVPLRTMFNHAARLVHLMPVDFASPARLDALLSEQSTRHHRDSVEWCSTLESCLRFVLLLLKKRPDHPVSSELAPHLWRQIERYDFEHPVLGHAVLAIAKLPDGRAKQALLAPWLDELIASVGHACSPENLRHAYLAAQEMGAAGQAAMAQLATVASEAADEYLHRTANGIFTQAVFFERLLACESLISNRENWLTQVAIQSLEKNLWSAEFLANQPYRQKRDFSALCVAIARQTGPVESSAERDSYRVSLATQLVGLIDAELSKAGDNREAAQWYLRDAGMVCREIEGKAMREWLASRLINSLLFFPALDIRSSVHNAEAAMALTVNRNEKDADPDCLLKMDRQEVLGKLLDTLPPDGKGLAALPEFEAPIRRHIASLCLLARAGVPAHQWVAIPAWLQPDVDALVNAAPSLQPGSIGQEVMQVTWPVNAHFNPLVAQQIEAFAQMDADEMRHLETEPGPPTP